jgi:tetratricopeptide (TPR) repeat protein
MPEGAGELYARALALAPSIGDQVRIPGSQRFVDGVNEAWELLERAAALAPGDARVQAARGNVLLRGGFVDAAREAYARAAALDPHDAASRYALAEVAYVSRDEATAQTWFDAAFARERLFSPPLARPGAKHALVLGLAGPWPRNMPLDFVVDDARWTLHRWFLPDPQRDARALPKVDLIVNALGESLAGAAALDDARAILAAHPAIPSVNDPERLRGLARDRLATTLAGVPGVRVPAARRIDRAPLAGGGAVEGIAFPLLVRPVDTHGGRGLEKIDAPAELAAYVARVPAERYDASGYIDYRSADGWFRKYRIMFVDGVAYPYHLAVDDRWMIHYYRTATTLTPWMHDEEARFLAEPERVIAGWHDAVPAVASALGLDYVGIDCAQLPDGTLVVFEADTAMLVHALDTSEAGRAKREGVARIRAALEALFERISDTRA